MGHLSSVFILFLAIFTASTECRKLLKAEENGFVVDYPSSFKSLLLAALPKGITVPASAPSKKTHATLDKEKLFMRHLANIDRILQSVPSPGAGH